MPVATAESICARYNVSRESRIRLDIYVRLLLEWQRRINLIGPSTVDIVWTRHIEDALQLLPLLPKQTQSIADLGSGAGIPGLILGIAYPYRVYLFESNNKKAAFLREAIRLTGADAIVCPVRIETLAHNPNRPVVDVVAARALAPLRRLLELAQPFLAAGAVGFFHKGQDVDAELTEATEYWRIDYTRHPSASDSKAVILEVREARPIG